MTIKRLLVFLPLLVTVILLQSYFWVPTFSDQVKGSDRRLSQYISGSIGDAQILNPILHADTTSGAIVDQVFDGLIDRDKNLRFRGRLATSWRIYEETFFAPRPDGPTAEALRDLIRAAVSAKSVPWANEVTGVEIAAAASEKVSIFLPPAKKGQKPRREAVTLAYPARVKVTLKSVDQDRSEERRVGKECGTGFLQEINNPAGAGRLRGRPRALSPRGAGRARKKSRARAGQPHRAQPGHHF